MKLDIYEMKEAQQKLKNYRDVKQSDCSMVLTPIGGILLVFNCPEVKKLVGEVDFIFTPSATSPTITTPARLLLDIDVPGRKSLKVAFRWDSGIPKTLLEATYLVFLAIKKPDKRGYSFPDDLLKFAKSGCLDIDLTTMRQNLESFILPTEMMVQLLGPLKAAVH